MTESIVRTKLGRNELLIETGKLAKQADGTVTVQLGGTVVLVTCVCSKEAREDADFFPLTVEYREKASAAGKIPGGFFKREGRPSEKEILTARLIDRPIRPLFNEDMANEVQVVGLVLSSDGENDSDILAVIGASASLSISDIPFDGPIGCVRVGLIDGNFVLNPTFKELENSALDLVVVGCKEGIIMIEAAANELGEEKIEEAVEFAEEHINNVIAMQNDLIKKCGKVKRNDIIMRTPREELCASVRKLAGKRLDEINKLSSKEKRQEAVDALTKELSEKFTSEDSSV